MSRLLTTSLLLLAATPAFAQPRQIRWNGSFNQAVAESKRTHKPLMIYIHGYSSERLVNEADIENDQRKAFQDPTVVMLADRFITVEGDFSGQRDLMRKWQMSDKTEFEVLFVTPEGDKIDSIGSSGVAQPVSLAQKMAACFAKYRNDYYNSKLRKILEDANSKAEEIKPALAMVSDFSILIADETLVAMLKRDKVPDAVRTQVLDTMAKLSTPTVAKYLLDQAPTDPKAAAALQKCTPAIAEQLIAWMQQGDDVKKQFMAYTIATKIVKITDTKNEAWWGKVNAKIKQDEITRVSNLIQRAAQDWKQRYGEYR